MKTASSIIIHLLLMALLSACFYESQVGLPSPQEALPESMQGYWALKDKKDIIHLWIEAPEEGANSNKGAIAIENHENNTSNEEKTPIRFSLASIKNQPLIQGAYKEENHSDSTYFFAKCEEKGKFMYFYLVQEELFRPNRGEVKQFSTSDSLKWYMEQVIDQKGFFEKKGMKFVKQ